MYDGHGRLYQSHKPEQRDSAGTTLKYTTYTYNADDTVATQTDGRGVVTTYTYGHVDDSGSSEYRSMLTKIAYTVPSGSGITDPSDVTFTYDSVGDRTSMTDGLGSVAYAYNSLSQMTSETRSFTDTLTDAPSSGNAFQLQYTYTLSGGLKSYTDPYGQEIDYGFDKAGRFNSVTGATSFAGITTYAHNPTYRAWGGLKHLEDGSGFNEDYTYNNKLQAATYVLDNPSDSNPATMSKTYTYYNDGALKLSDEGSSTFNDKFDRLNQYDFAARTKFAFTGTEAHGTTETDLTKLPYRQELQYNAFSNLTAKYSTFWDTTSWSFSYTYANNRPGGTTVDNDGRVTADNVNFQYDAPGVADETDYPLRYETHMYHDGQGHEAKRATRDWSTPDDEGGSWNEWQTSYFLYSSVIGENVSETTATGKKFVTHVFAGGSEIARQAIDTTPTQHVGFQHRDPMGTSARTTLASGETGADVYDDEEMDGTGTNVGTFKPLVLDPYNSVSAGDKSPLTDPDYAGQSNGIVLPGSVPSDDRGTGPCKDIEEGLRSYACAPISQAAVYFNFAVSGGLPKWRYAESGVRILDSRDQGSKGGFWYVEGLPESIFGSAMQDAQTYDDRCLTLHVAITNSAKLSEAELTQMKAEIARVHAQAGISVSFVNQGADYWLQVNSVGAAYSNKWNAVGETPLRSDSTVDNRGRVFVDRLVASARSSLASKLLYDNEHAYSPLAIGLGRAGSHEIDHFVLQQNEDGPDYTGVMRAQNGGAWWFGQSQDRLSAWTYNPGQAALLRLSVQELRGCSPGPSGRIDPHSA